MTLSCFTVSLLRKWTPMNIRMMVQTLIIAFYVIIVDVSLKAYWPEMSTNLGPYVGLIITNCIIMGRCEAFARSNSPMPSVVDGFFNGIGYSLILIIISVLRELLGMGTILGFEIPYFATTWDKWIIMVMPPGAFFTLACVIWIFRSFKPKEKTK
jgi:Na+-transporting NADH:ubiquinone oxidoreductase subunit D